MKYRMIGWDYQMWQNNFLFLSLNRSLGVFMLFQCVIAVISRQTWSRESQTMLVKSKRIKHQWHTICLLCRTGISCVFKWTNKNFTRKIRTSKDDKTMQCYQNLLAVVLLTSVPWHSTCTISIHSFPWLLSVTLLLIILA